MTPDQLGVMELAKTSGRHLSDYERKFCADMFQRPEDYELSEKQDQLIRRIASKIRKATEKAQESLASGSGLSEQGEQGEQEAQGQKADQDLGGKVPGASASESPARLFLESCETLDDLARFHWRWVESMGWHNKTDLEAMALVATEVGEAAAEWQKVEADQADDTTPFLGELADVVLRLVDLTGSHKRAPMALVNWVETGVDPLDPGQTLYQLMVDYYLATNELRNGPPSDTCLKHLALMCLRCLQCADWFGENLLHHIQAKCLVNLERGTRGRRI